MIKKLITLVPPPPYVKQTKAPGIDFFSSYMTRATLQCIQCTSKVDENERKKDKIHTCNDLCVKQEPSGRTELGGRPWSRSGDATIIIIIVVVVAAMTRLPGGGVVAGTILLVLLMATDLSHRVAWYDLIFYVGSKYRNGVKAFKSSLSSVIKSVLFDWLGVPCFQNYFDPWSFLDRWIELTQ